MNARVAGIERAGEHEILPDQQAELVAQVVEVLGLVDPAAPDAHHVHVGRDRGLQVARIIAPGEAGDKGARRDPVGALCENRPAVDDELERLAPFVRLAVERDRPQPDPAHSRADPSAVGTGGLDLESCRAAGPLAVRPPELRASGSRMRGAGAGPRPVPLE